MVASLLFPVHYSEAHYLKLINTGEQAVSASDLG